MSARDLNLVITPRALADLHQIYLQTIDRWGEEQATSYEERIRAAINHLTRNPRMGRRDRRADGNVRSFSLEHHTIYYRSDDTNIYIMRVVHYRQAFRSSMLTESNE
jgi:toxin ParE1/3/4